MGQKIKIDIKIHDSQKEYDEYRNKFLQNLNIITLRVKDEVVLNNIEILKKSTRKHLSLLTIKI